MADYRRVFFSFHYANDIFRVNQIRKLPQMTSRSRAGFEDQSLWESVKGSDSAVKKRIDDGLEGTSVTVVCIGSETASRRWVKYEIAESAKRVNGIIGIHISHLHGGGLGSAARGTVPEGLDRVYTFTNQSDLALWIETAAASVGL